MTITELIWWIALIGSAWLLAGVATVAIYNYAKYRTRVRRRKETT